MASAGLLFLHMEGCPRLRPRPGWGLSAVPSVASTCRERLWVCSWLAVPVWGRAQICPHTSAPSVLPELRVRVISSLSPFGSCGLGSFWADRILKFMSFPWAS